MKKIMNMLIALILPLNMALAVDCTDVDNGNRIQNPERRVTCVSASDSSEFTAVGSCPDGSSVKPGSQGV